MKCDLISEAIDYFNLNPEKIVLVEESFSSIVRISEFENGGKLVLKIPFVHKKMQHEPYALNELQDYLPVPQVVGYWSREDGNSGALLLSFLPGNPKIGSISPCLAYSIGAPLGELHARKLERFEEVCDPTGDFSPSWWIMLKHVFQTWIPLCGEILSEEMIQNSIYCFE